MESTAMGLLAGINALRVSKAMAPSVPPPGTAIGALIHYIVHSGTLPFQPMNMHFGLFPPLSGKARGREKRRLLAERALSDMNAWVKRVEEAGGL
jgi:methylenetetrahydrofolate--tRNA-(uracil-5-)-methyltransferase